MSFDESMSETNYNFQDKDGKIHLRTWKCECGSFEMGVICNKCKAKFREHDHEIID